MLKEKGLSEKMAVGVVDVAKTTTIDYSSSSSTRTSGRHRVKGSGSRSYLARWVLYGSF